MRADVMLALIALATIDAYGGIVTQHRAVLAPLIHAHSCNAHVILRKRCASTLACPAAMCEQRESEADLSKEIPVDEERPPFGGVPVFELGLIAFLIIGLATGQLDSTPPSAMQRAAAEATSRGT